MSNTEYKEVHKCDINSGDDDCKFGVIDNQHVIIIPDPERWHAPTIIIVTYCPVCGERLE